MAVLQYQNKVALGQAEFHDTKLKASQITQRITEQEHQVLKYENEKINSEEWLLEKTRLL